MGRRVLGGLRLDVQSGLVAGRGPVASRGKTGLVWLAHFAGGMMGVRGGGSWGFEEGRETAHRFKVEAGSTANFQSSSSAEDLIC